MRTLYKPSLRGPRKRTNSLLPICIPWNMLHIVPALNIVQNAASTCLPFLVVVPVVPTGCGLILDIESVKPWPNFIRSTYRYYSLITFQVGCISCHPFGLSVTHAPQTCTWSPSFGRITPFVP